MQIRAGGDPPLKGGIAGNAGIEQYPYVPDRRIDSKESNVDCRMSTAAKKPENIEENDTKRTIKRQKPHH